MTAWNLIGQDDTPTPTKVSLVLVLYYAPTIVFTGCIGNIISIVVFFQRSFIGQNGTVYFIFLAVLDTLVLVTGALRHFLRRATPTGFDIREMSLAMCKIQRVLVYSAMGATAWILVATTLERIYLSFYQKKAKMLLTTVFAIKVNLISIAVSTLFNSYPIIMSGTEVYVQGNVTRYKKCGLPSEWARVFVLEIRPWIDNVLYSIGPFFIMLICNFVLIKRMAASGSGGTLLEMVDSRSKKRRARAERRMTITSVTVCLVYLFLTLPQQLNDITISFFEEDLHQIHQGRLIEEMLDDITDMLKYTNHSINFWLYLITNSQFRATLLFLCFRNCSKKYKDVPETATENEEDPGGVGNCSQRQIFRFNLDKKKQDVDTKTLSLELLPKGGESAELIKLNGNRNGTIQTGVNAPLLSRNHDEITESPWTRQQAPQQAPQQVPSDMRQFAPNRSLDGTPRHHEVRYSASPQKTVVLNHASPDAIAKQNSRFPGVEAAQTISSITPKHSTRRRVPPNYVNIGSPPTIYNGASESGNTSGVPTMSRNGPVFANGGFGTLKTNGSVLTTPERVQCTCRKGPPPPPPLQPRLKRLGEIRQRALSPKMPRLTPIRARIVLYDGEYYEAHPV